MELKEENGINIVRCTKEEVAWDGGKPLAVCIPDFRGMGGDPTRLVIFIEYYDGQLQVRVYNGGEDPIPIRHDCLGGVIALKPDPALTEAVYCPKEDLPKLLSSEDEAVREIVENRLKNGA